MIKRHELTDIDEAEKSAHCICMEEKVIVSWRKRSNKWECTSRLFTQTTHHKLSDINEDKKYASCICREENVAITWRNRTNKWECSGRIFKGKVIKHVLTEIDTKALSAKCICMDVRVRIGWFKKQSRWMCKAIPHKPAKHLLTHIDENQKTADCTCMDVRVRIQWMSENQYWYCSRKPFKGRIQHHLSNIDEENKTAICSTHGPVRICMATVVKTERSVWYCAQDSVERARINRHKRRAINAAAMTEEDKEITAEYRKAMINDPCVYCGDKADSDDHKIAMSRGGTDHWWNLVRSCRTCNASKGNKTPEEFFVWRVKNFITI